MKKPEKKHWNLVCQLYQGRGIPAADDMGSSDPYVKFYVAGQEAKSSIKKDTLNPVYYGTYELKVEFDRAEDADPIIVSLFD